MRDAIPTHGKGERIVTSTGTDETTRTAIQHLYKAFSEKDINALRKAVTADWLYIPEPPGAAPGPDQMIPLFRNMEKAIPDMKIEIIDLLVQGDRAAIRAQVSGTQRGELMGIAATSKPVRFAIHSFHEMRGPLVAKTWHLEDWLDVFRQLGQMPSNLDLHR
jgi:predicted ester cyclase